MAQPPFLIAGFDMKKLLDRSCGLLCGAALFAIMTKVGAYAILRTTTLIFPPDTAATGAMVADLMLPAALVTLAVGAIGILGATTLPRLAAFAGIASMGTLFTAFAAFTPQATAAGLGGYAGAGGQLPGPRPKASPSQLTGVQVTGRRVPTSMTTAPTRRVGPR